MRCLKRSLVVALLALGRASVVVAEVPAAEPREVAASHFAEGERAYAAGDYRAAAIAFESAHIVDPQPASAWNAARAWHLAGELARGATFYRRYLDVAPTGAQDRDEATRHLLALAAEVARVEVVGAEPSILRIDGRPALAAVLYLVPGTHRIEAEFSEGRVTVLVELTRGELRSILLERPQLPMPHNPAANETNRERSAQAPSTQLVSPDSPGGASVWLLVPFVALSGLSGVLTVASAIDTQIALDQYLAIPAEERTLAQWEDGKFKQDRTNVAIGISAGLGLASLAVALFAVDFGEGRLVGFDSGGLRVHF